MVQYQSKKVEVTIGMVRYWCGPGALQVCTLLVCYRYPPGTVEVCSLYSLANRTAVRRYGARGPAFSPRQRCDDTTVRRNDRGPPGSKSGGVDRSDQREKTSVTTQGDDE